MHIYPLELIALNDATHALKCIYYKLDSHATIEANELDIIIKRNTKVIKQYEKGIDANQY